MKTFEKSFTQQEPIPEAAIERAVAVMRGGRLHRYNAAGDEPTETELLEQEFAAYLGVPYCLACASGGYAIYVALKCAGVEAGDAVLCNAFTLSPVPGAINNAGANPVFVETTEDLTIDVEHLDRVAEESGAKYLLLSHMRGHIGDMDAITAVCEARGVVLIEDCAHTMGAYWKGRASGTFGQVAAFSTQTYKHINSGEGGFLTTDDPALMARATLLSGSYMLYGRHIAAPDGSAFESLKLVTPNYSGRMDNLRAAILRVQLESLDDSCRRWNERYAVLERGLRDVSAVRVTRREQHERYVGSSFQFSVPGFSASRVNALVDGCAARGVAIKWFGDENPHGYTSRYDSWRYVADAPRLPRTLEILSTLCDLRVPLTFSVSDCETIAEIVADEVTRLAQSRPVPAP